MDGETPTFCKELLGKKSCSFSSACQTMAKSKFKKSESESSINLKKYSKFKKSESLKQFKNGGNIKIKKKSKFKNIHFDIDHKKRKIHHSQKFFPKNTNNIKDFIENHKFKLRNDFDKKHVEKFLSSKEEAFKIPFLLSEEMSSTTIKS